MSATSSAGRTPVDLARCGQFEMQLVERAGGVGDDGGGDVQIKGGGCQLGVAERTRAIMRTFYVIEIESSPERDSMLANDAALSCHTRAGPLP
jgi:hypothetical protein